MKEFGVRDFLHLQRLFLPEMIYLRNLPESPAFGSWFCGSHSGLCFLGYPGSLLRDYSNIAKD